MDADDHEIEVILSEGRRFMVPLYQRKYQWADNRLLPFWDDVQAKAAEELEHKTRFQHYMGALILAPIGEAAQIGVTPRVQVVDGQQRLTTFQLLLTAIREVAREYDCTNIIAYVNDYIFNKPKSKDTDSLTRFKLTPTPSDREVFHDILDKEWGQVRTKYSRYYWGRNVPKNTPLKALRAYELFKQHIDLFVLSGPVDAEAESGPGPEDQDDEPDKNIIEVRLEALLRAVLSRMKLVVITLGEGDDAQVIFETLNSQGEPLLAMDLVRNNIFYRAEKEGASAEELYKELWDPFDHTWWREPAPYARPRRPRIDHFLAHVLAAESGERISMRELYAEYRAFTVSKGRPRFTRVKDELRVLDRHAPTYETLEGRQEHDKRIAWLGRKLAAWQITTAYPIALQIAVDDVEEEARSKIAELIYSYIVRRALCGLTAKNRNRVFQGISHKFLVSGPSLSSLTEFFAERASDSTRFPSDDEFRQGILSQAAYINAPGARIKDVLWELECATRTNFAEKVEMPEGLQTEHVLPVTWTEDWTFADGEWVDERSDDPRVVRRAQALHTLGNLTLITGGLNVSSGNKGFLAKKEKYEEHTSLFLNKWFADHEEWHEEKILCRGEALSEKAMKIWVGLIE